MFACLNGYIDVVQSLFNNYSNPLKYTSLRAAEKVVHFKFEYIEIAYT